MYTLSLNYKQGQKAFSTCLKTLRINSRRIGEDQSSKDTELVVSLSFFKFQDLLPECNATSLRSGHWGPKGELQEKSSSLSHGGGRQRPTLRKVWKPLEVFSSPQSPVLQKSSSPRGVVMEATMAAKEVSAVRKGNLSLSGGAVTPRRWDKPLLPFSLSPSFCCLPQDIRHSHRSSSREI